MAARRSENAPDLQGGQAGGRRASEAASGGRVAGLAALAPYADIGPGCHELRVADEKTAHRLFYAVRADAIVILGVVTKKSRTTPQSILKSCSARLRRFEEV